MDRRRASWSTPRPESLKSDHSKGWLPDFREPPPEDLSYRTDYLDPSGTGFKPRLKRARKSTTRRFSFRKPPDEEQSTRKVDPRGPGPGSKPRLPFSCESLKSDHSKGWLPDFREPLSEHQSIDMDQWVFPLTSTSRPRSNPSFASLNSGHSMGWLPDFREPPPEDQTSTRLRNDQRQTWFTPSAEPNLCSSDEHWRWEPNPEEKLNSTFKLLEVQIVTFVKEELRKLHRILVSDYPESSPESEEEKSSSSEAVLTISLDFLRRMKQEPLAERLSSMSSAGVCRDKLKKRLQQKFTSVFEGVAKAGNSAPLHQIYTNLHIVEGGASMINQQHEVRHIENRFRKASQAEISITCEDLFKGPIPTKKSKQAELTEELPIRTVLMKGVAGIGKTVLTQKFSLDWAEGRANQDIQLLFPFAFRELNVLQDTKYNLVELVHHCYSETKGLGSIEDLHVLFIFDGLDECRIPLDFSRTRVLTEPSESASVEELLVNLIRGSLLPCARLWITTRPAAANQIPGECISMVTEVQGFTNLHKELYFMKRFGDEQQAIAIISHIKSIHSLYIMCYIPVFCWILSTVLLHLIETRETEDLPRTLTQMYIYFLVVQAKVKNIKYHGGSGADLPWTPETLEMVWSLAKLAFEQLMKGNLIFYEQDLRECGLDAAEIARYSGVFTEMFREESGLYQNKIFCFIHLTIQEFMAALHAHQTFFSTGVNLLSPSHSDSPEAFYRSVIDLALKSPNGHMDMFLRYLLGFSLSANQNLLTGLLAKTESDSTNQETVKYIKLRLNERDRSAERSLNLLHCLNELNDHSLMEEIQTHIREERLSLLHSPAQWSALSFFLLSSESELREFDLKKYQASETTLLKLLPVVKASGKAFLSGCGLTEKICAPLASVLCSSSLTDLNLSNNDLQDTGVELLCSGLESTFCRLETLRLSGCMISERGGAALASALSSTASSLRELDLSYNDPGSSAKLLTALQAPTSPLTCLRLDPAGQQWMVPGLRKYSCEFSLAPNSAQKKLHLSEDKLTVTKVRDDQHYPRHEERFTNQPQVLGSTGLRGRCYWEVKWSGEKVDIAVSYRRIKRRGHTVASKFGDNDQSWSLRIYNGRYSVCHNNRETDLLYNSHSLSGSGVVGVFLDSDAGMLSFYEVRFGGEHIYTFNSSITEPLFPGFGLENEADSVSVVDLRRMATRRPQSHFGARS